MSADTLKLILEFVGPFSAVATLGWWLRGQFSERDRLLYARMDEIKAENQTRHEQNLSQFSRVYVALTQLGWRNGH
jgi:hypothetical protein